MTAKTIIVMGVSGCGKSTLGRELAKHLHYLFLEGDAFHPPANIEKMAQGTPLTDTDRLPWLQLLNRQLRETEQPIVLACSALKESYREVLANGLNEPPLYLYLDGSFSLIYERIASRTGHFMPPELLQSQFLALEVPAECIRLSIDAPMTVLVETALATIIG